MPRVAIGDGVEDDPGSSSEAPPPRGEFSLRDLHTFFGFNDQARMKKLLRKAGVRVTVRFWKPGSTRLRYGLLTRDEVRRVIAEYWKAKGEKLLKTL